MARDIATRNEQVPAEPAERNWAEEYGDEAFQSNIVGRLLKFIKGEWLAGQEEESVPIGTELVAAMHILQSGWIRWENNAPVDSVMGIRADGFRPPPRETLGYLDKSTWGELNGQIIDPWRRTDILYLADPKDGQVYTFSPMSEGGLGAVKALTREYGPHLRTDPNEIPIVRLGSTWYKHAQFGKVYKPVLEVSGWRNIDDVSFVVADDEEQREEAPRSTSRAAQERHAKPAPKAAAKAKAPLPPPPRRGSNAGRRI